MSDERGNIMSGEMRILVESMRTFVESMRTFVRFEASFGQSKVVLQPEEYKLDELSGIVRCGVWGVWLEHPGEEAYEYVRFYRPEEAIDYFFGLLFQLRSAMAYTHGVRRPVGLSEFAKLASRKSDAADDVPL